MRRRRILLALLVLLLALVAVSRWTPKVTHIDVVGARHYDEAELLALADLEPGRPFFWITPWSLRGLRDDPWILRVHVVREFPDAVSVAVVEREAALFDGETAYAFDGTVLPGVGNTDQLTRLTGWGTRDLDEILKLYRMLVDFEPSVIRYSPSGYEVELAETVLFTPSAADLARHWAGFLSHQGRYVAVYPWGVSIQP